MLGIDDSAAVVVSRVVLIVRVVWLDLMVVQIMDCNGVVNGALHGVVNSCGSQRGADGILGCL